MKSVYPGIYCPKLRVLFALSLALALPVDKTFAVAPEIPVGSNPEDRPPLPIATQNPPETGSCVIIFHRRLKPAYNFSNLSVTRYAGNSSPAQAPNGTQSFTKVTAAWVYINSPLTKDNVLYTNDNKPQNHYIGWGKCPFGNSADQSAQIGGWAPQTTSCWTWNEPWLDALKPLPARQFGYDLNYAGATFGAAMPATVTAKDSTGTVDVTYHLKTNGQGGSDDCFAVFLGGTSPLVIDLRGTGVKFTAPGEHVQFDYGDGVEPSVWIANSDGAPFLALDENNNGVIDNVNELFGNSTHGPDHRGATNGFQALGKYDSNKDGVIDAKDTIFAKLVLWADKNVDGHTDQGELQPLTGAGIASINLKYEEQVDFADNFGNLSHERSAVTMSDGSSKTVYDVWFAPADPFGVKGHSPVQVKPLPVPKEGAANYDDIHNGWQQAVDSAGFSQSEMPYISGETQSYLDKSGKPDHHTVTWKHQFDSCRVQATFSGDWTKMQNSSGSCS